MLYLQIIASFVVGGLAIAFQTIIAERAPLRWRGMVLTIPSTMALGFFFIGLVKSPADMVEVARFFPAALMPDYIYVLVFAYLSQFNLLISFSVSLIVWAIFAYLIVIFPPTNFLISTFIYGLPLITISYFLVKKLPQVTNLTPVAMNWKHITIRSLIGGSIIVVAVVLAKTMGNIWGSLFSAFPAAFSATFLIYYFVHGKSIIPSVAKSVFFPGVFGFILYAGIAGLTFPRFGIWIGTLISYFAVFLFYRVHSMVSSSRKITES